MPRLVLDSATDRLDLDDVLNHDVGVQALSGVTGLGLPAVQTQWQEGAGDGGLFRGKRVPPRDIDIPIYVAGWHRSDLKARLSRLAVMLANPCTLRLVEDDGSDWSTDVVRVGGGQYTYGVDTNGETDLRTVITLRAGDPYWTYSRATSKRITNAGAGRGLVGKLASLKVASSQAIGTMALENELGDADAYPLWTVTGPGRDFRAISRSGESFHWTGVLAAGERLVIDTRSGTVRDGNGVNRYADLAAAPRLWRIPPGITEATASLDSTTTSSSITCTWRPRKWMVI
ncbi:phage tail family protein [Micromonospora sp. NPDC048839]|uniref:phage tail family protein n=1 Tax=Micromonospora sp. NPDC048839 TaxID=3155641 RepID=UPI0033F6ED88